MLIKTTVRPPSVANATGKLQHVNDNGNPPTSSKVRLVVLGNSRVGKSVVTGNHKPVMDWHSSQEEM
ncbi:hypothetical protein RUM43_001370 [Polyplax serrata]|uniref:Uncharacterized protein n=1 Tax=Polyplax serrata TaxID=468196 RepID=A0AAN8SF89_POLSC